MAAIKFSKQNIKPNPQEVDYWVDVTTNPYGGRIKYFNGIDWVDLVNVNGNAVDLSSYFTKQQINAMLSEKASHDEVNNKINKLEANELIKNIEIRTLDDSGVQLVLLKYDDTTVGVSLPIADSTSSGIITPKSFNDFVKQNQLQGLYTEMYDKLAEIRGTYQKKLKAGTNIKIDENNTIHAVSDVSLDWEDIYNKPDFDAEFQAISNQVVSETNRAVNAENQLSSRIDDHVGIVEDKLDLKANSKDVYTKDQIDEKISGVYRIKGSRSFNDLPDVNKIGDVYNISNEFVLDGVTYPVGTNIVYTATGWDALSGVFDITELEELVEDIDTKIDEEVIRAKAKELELDTKFDNYLPLSGGTLSSSAGSPLNINRTNGYSTIDYSINNVTKGILGFDYTGDLIVRPRSETNYNYYSVLNSNNTNIENGIITINGTSITPLTQHLSLANYVTLDTEQIITNRKTIDGDIYFIDSTLKDHNVRMKLGFNKSKNQTSFQIFDPSFQRTNTAFGFLMATGGDYQVRIFDPSDMSDPVMEQYMSDSNLLIRSAFFRKIDDQNKICTGTHISSKGTGAQIVSMGTTYNYGFRVPISNDSYPHSSTVALFGDIVFGKYVNLKNNTFAYVKYNHEENKINISSCYTEDRESSNQYRSVFTDIAAVQINGNDIWHAGNDGEGSGLDADTLDGLHKESLFVNHKWSGDMTDANTSNLFGVYYYGGSATNMPNSSGLLVAFNAMGDKYQGMQLFCFNKYLYFRSRWGDHPWKTVAFTDSDITGNAATSNRLKTDSSGLSEYSYLLYNYGGFVKGETVDGSWNAPGDQFVFSDGQKGDYGSILRFKMGAPVEDPYYADLFSNANKNELWFRTVIKGVSKPWAQIATTNSTVNNATKLNNKPSSDFYDLTGGTRIPANSDLNDYKTIGTYYVSTDNNAETILNSPTLLAFTVKIIYPTGTDAYRKQILTVWYNNGNTYVRTYVASNDTWSPWTLTTTDLNNYTAPTATKLKTPVKLWGNDFDGSSNINEKIILKNGAAIYSKDTENVLLNLLDFNLSNTLAIGYSVTRNGYNTILSGNTIYFNTSTDYNTKMLILPNGNVGVGVNNPQYKLDVNGLLHSSGVSINNEFSYYAKNTTGDDVSIMRMSTSNNLIIGLGTAENGNATYIHGNKVIIRSAGDTSHTMTINELGNVTIGSTDRNAGYKLDVEGTTVIRGGLELSYVTPYIDFHYDNQGSVDYTSRIIETEAGKLKCFGSWDVTNSASVANELYVGNKISSGDLVDWYGVSWSEDSSDPTCTRIGNMALHRSLPILSAMKGYWISNKNASNGTPEMIIPVNDSFTHLKYTGNENSIYDINYLINGGIFIKIPEFWYIDDYEPSTKTHNLKISQTAKAGWCHHKEAYVGAYEGYSDDTYYKSIKNVIPTVSVSRTDLRPLARANGYEDEYKWNIYTYEEHRAICHLFLVEYATRNSQAPVNTELTADGFKQGGLGSGCTTATATVNGVTTYAFVPTGTTDSLGNGSGQVAYTHTNTDANGNTIDTITVYANRYRGIENPFGHIWKNVDDIVDVYNAETTFKIVYKCNKPEHFATNKNTKYKPLCSFPGGSKMQGWSKEIKATINCDFFKYSVGGSESTYWCDYNYSSDDTSEHCLPIGGRSGYGGQAGLFAFNLNSRVYVSHVNVGSRLTYLPWAE